MELAPDQVGPAANLGSLYLKRGRFEQARELLEQASTRDPRSIEVRTNLIVALGRQEKLEEARLRFDDGVRISGPQPQFLNAMAFAFHLNKRPEEAIPLLESSLRIRPKQVDAADLLRKVQQAAGSREQN